jgi:tetratricopeptide (TPR) repeat protein
MVERAARSQTRPYHPAGTRLGERLRQLRVAAGLTQSDLAGDRFSKEYLSQIERGKTRPTPETIAWLAARLGVDPNFLANGVSADQRSRVEASLARAEALLEHERADEAVEAFNDVRPAATATGLPELEVRTLTGLGKALAVQGDPRAAIEVLGRARELSEGPEFSDVERADVLYRLGVCRYRLSSITTAVGLLNQALELAERSGMPCDLLQSEILHWRSRCYRRQRDYEAAREDVERGLELAERLADLRAMGPLYFQASLLAERQGHYVLARSYAERAVVGKLQNNLGALSFLLGKHEDAVKHLKAAFASLLEAGRDAEAGYAVSSLAQVHLRTGDAATAEEQARHALKLLGDGVDVLDEIGNAHLVLGRALLEQDRLDEAEGAFAKAEASFDQLSSASHRASAWVAQGDLAARRGDDRAAARLYRRAAEALQDVRF